MERIFGTLITLAILFACLTSIVGIPQQAAGGCVVLVFILLTLFPGLLHHLLRCAAIGVVVLTLVMYLRGQRGYVPFGISLLVVLAIADLLLQSMLPKRWRYSKRRW